MFQLFLDQTYSVLSIGEKPDYYIYEECLDG